MSNLAREFKSFLEGNLCECWIMNGNVFEGSVEGVQGLEKVSEDEWYVMYNGSYSLLEMA